MLQRKANLQMQANVKQEKRNNLFIYYLIKFHSYFAFIAY